MEAHGCPASCVKFRKPCPPFAPDRRPLLEAKQNTAMLTTFNEIDMSRAMAMRTLTRRFQEKFGCRLGFMSFFIKACVEP
jgi:2-oxoglutarate dehydrogenase E2 component (dihydrolipoamide succinyltransferase)